MIEVAFRGALRRASTYVDALNPVRVGGQAALASSSRLQPVYWGWRKPKDTNDLVNSNKSLMFRSSYSYIHLLY